MAEISRASLKSFYETGDFPTEGQFSDLIDSSPNFVDDGASVLKFVRVPIATAAVLTLNSSPVQIVPAPGAGFGIQLLGWSVRITFNTTPYGINTQLQLISPSGGFPQGINFNVLPSPVSPHQIGAIGTGPGAMDNVVVDNEALNLITAVGDPTTGDSDIVVYANFVILTL
ncbi:MAG: hypothetical protein V3T88_08655 [Nitrosomonadaceae bacterium]